MLAFYLSKVCKECFILDWEKLVSNHLRISEYSSLIYVWCVCMFCYSRLPSPCFSEAEPLTQSSLFLFTVPLWSHCRSRSVSLMLSVNEVACIVPGATKGRHALHTELQRSSSAAVLASLPPCNGTQVPRSFSTSTSWVRGERGRGAQEGTVRKWCVLLL